MYGNYSGDLVDTKEGEDMEFIKNYIAILTGFLFLASIVQTFLPDGTMKQSLRMLLGIILSVLLITPFAGAKFENVDIFPSNDEYTIYSERVQSMETLKQQQAQTLFRDSMAQMVQEILNQNGISEEVQVEVVTEENGNLQQIIIHKSVPALKEKIAARLGISAGQIQMTE